VARRAVIESAFDLSGQRILNVGAADYLTGTVLDVNGAQYMN
jgi:hypothetical protein